ncbi:MAG: PTS sugar transporter subunit IIB [Gemmatimonadota bacterium]|nr:PTS sugar transporter subunit IIB [Gemmatimonadota bacterium]
MTVALFRVDERLIHGQVVVGWGRALGVRRIVVVDDEIAEEPLEQEIYRTGLPKDVRADFWGISHAVDRLPELMESDEEAFVLTETLQTMWRLAVEGVPIARVNVGGLHAAPGRRRILPYVCLDPEQEQRVRDLEAAGVEVLARDVPSAPAVRLIEAGV